MLLYSESDSLDPEIERVFIFRLLYYQVLKNEKDQMANCIFGF